MDDHPLFFCSAHRFLATSAACFGDSVRFAPLQGWLTRVWQVGVALLGAAVVLLAWLQPRARPVPASAEFELVMEPTRKHTPDLPRAQAV